MGTPEEKIQGVDDPIKEEIIESAKVSPREAESSKQPINAEQLEKIQQGVQRAFAQSRLDEPGQLLARVLADRERNRFTPIVPDAAGRKLHEIVLEYQATNTRADAVLADFENLSSHLEAWASNLHRFQQPRGSLRDDPNEIRRVHRSLSELTSRCMDIIAKLRTIEQPAAGSAEETALNNIRKSLMESGKGLDRHVAYVAKWSRFIDDYLHR